MNKKYINKIKNILLNEKGFSLPLILVIFVVFTILFTSAIYVTQANTAQIDSQEDNLRAYYVARSGIDMPYAALMQADSDVNYPLKADRLIDEGVGTIINHNDLDVPKINPIGTVDIEVTVLDDEIKIRAVSTMIDDSETDVISFYFRKDNFSKNRWENN